MSPVIDQRVNRNDWSLIVKTENGTVSTLKNLSLHQAYEAYDALDERQPPGTMRFVNGGDMRSRTVIGPEGWDGCRKAFHHDYIDAYELVEPSEWRPKDDPKIGKYFHYKKCRFCGASDVTRKSEYLDGPPNPCIK